MSYVRSVRFAGGLIAAILVAGPVSAAVAPKKDTALAAKEYRHPQLHIENRVQRVEEQAAAARTSLLDSLAELRVSSPAAYIDPRTGRFATLLPAEPLLPGTGEGNTLEWADLGVARPDGVAAWQRAAWDALVRYVEQHSAALGGIDVAELVQPGSITVHDDGAVIQIHAPRVINNVRVRDSHLTAVINHGNLVLFGAANWGTIRLETAPSLSPDQAVASLRSFLNSGESMDFRRKATLAIVPLSSGPLESLNAFDRGLDYRLVWVLSPRFIGNMGTWEALVDAHSGEMIAFTDTNQYQSVRRVQGGVYPVSNDLVPPDGTEQPGWPFPFADVATASGNFFTDTGGNLGVCATGNITTTLNGRFVRMADVCGAASLTGGGNLDFGVSAGTNCVTPGIGGPGNTHASRTGFFELNQIIEQAKGQIPANVWLQQQLTSNMNINLNCNAFWSGSTVNFYIQGGGCNNTGEIAAIFDHEWGHGMDNNDTTGTISNPGEGIADVYMALRLKESCVGRNFRNTNCGGYGNPCLACTGVRDIDWDQRANHTPTTITWIDANCGGGPAPCGGGVHCEGSVFSETVWDLFSRDLPAAGYSADTALEIATRTTYIGASPMTAVYQCVQGSGGCPATAAYLNFLAADDDNGNINNGTPHYGPIRAAFDRHGIACPTPVTGTSGCALAPDAAPTVTGTPIDKGARLSWTSVPGAVKYRVYRTDGVFGCNFGKVLLGETFGTTWADEGLQNGRQYFYTVSAVGMSNTCLGPMSACTTVTPAAGAHLSADISTLGVAFGPGNDGDTFLDNCETATVTIPTSNTGGVAQTNVRVLAAQPLSHPGMVVTGFNPGVALAACANSTAPGFTFRATDLIQGDVVRFRVDMTSDQLSPAVRTFVLALPVGTESNNQFFASRTFTFETDAEGWGVFEGTFNRTNAAPGGSGGPGTFYFQSSSFLDSQCDEVRSPQMSLTATSTLSLQNNFDIEPFSAGSWYDRANMARVSAAGVRTVITPDGGRLYNASAGNFTSCGMTNQVGWADAMTTWAPSTFTAGALGSAGVAGQPIRLSARYGLDGAANGAGFRLDTVTVTDVNVPVPDTGSNQCSVGNLPPVAVPDNSSTATFGPVIINVLSNDSDPNAGQCIRVTSVTAPANGTAVINSVGCPNTDTVRYIPNLTCGPPCNDSFQYTISDQNGGTASATVTINQVPVELQNFKVE